MSYFLLFEFAIFALFIITICRDKQYTNEDKKIIIGALCVSIFGIYVIIPMLLSILNYIFVIPFIT